MNLSTLKSNRSRESITGFLSLSLLSAVLYLVVSLTIRCIEDPMRMDSDEQEYYSLAGAFLDHTYAFNLRRPPIYILVIYFIRLFTGDNLLATRAVVSMCFSISAPLMYLLARRFTGHNRFALAIGAATIFWPPFLYYGNSLYSETLALPVFTLALLSLPLGSLVPGGAQEGWWRAGVAGLVLGVCMLMRPMYLLFSPFAVAILFFEESNWTIALRRALLLIAACLLIVAPWSAYLSTKAGKFLLVSANGGETLSGGLTPVLLEKGYRFFVAPDGRPSWSGPGKWVSENETGYLTDEEMNLPYQQRGVILEHRAVSWALTHPISASRLEFAKLAYMWGIYPFWNGAKQTILGNIPVVGALGLTIVSLLRFRNRLRQLSRFWSLPLFSCVVALVSWGSWRFREPGDFGLIMLSGLLIWSVMTESDVLEHSFLNRRRLEKFTPLA
jgi:4-amino-4-deoxy-L-arabinose transferase-like glycosyltransferase